MKELIFYTMPGVTGLKSADKMYGLRLHSNEPKFIIVDVPGDKFVFNNFDDALTHAKKDGYEPSQKELTYFLIELVHKRKDATEFKLGKYELFKQILNPVVLKVVQKYGIDSKQAKAVLLLYKD
jgi:hypothetical protein